jgi:hypothetical protein
MDQCLSEARRGTSTEELTCRLRAARIDLEGVIAGRLPSDHEVLEGIVSLLRAAERAA